MSNRHVTALLLIVALVAVACGSDGDDTGYPSGSIEPGRAHIPDADSAVYVFDPSSGEFVAR